MLEHRVHEVKDDEKRDKPEQEAGPQMLVARGGWSGFEPPEERQKPGQVEQQERPREVTQPDQYAGQRGQFPPAFHVDSGDNHT